MDEIVNKVANSGLITLDLAEYYPEGNRKVIDLKDQLWQEIALKEKDFREWIKENDWLVYTNCHVAVYCSADAIIPTWAYMLVSSALQGIASTVVFGDASQLEAELWRVSLNKIDPSEFQDGRVIIKGCSDREVTPHAFMLLTSMLKPQVKSLMFGEPCSTVPVYKKPRP